MSTEPGDKPSFLTRFADAYEPTDADADRVLSKVQAALGNGASSSSTPPTRAPSTASNKGLFIGLACVAIAALSVVAVRSTNEDTAPAPVVAAASHVENAPPASAPAAVDRESAQAIPSVAVDALPTANAPERSATAAKRITASSSVTERAPAPADDTLEREARLLASARRALQDNDGERALALLDEHAKTFPNGWLASDRAAERVVVLCTLGRRDDARREAAAFLAGRPKSPLTRRVEMSCAGQP